MEKFNWKSRPKTPHYMKISKILSARFHRFLKEGGDLKEILKECQAEIDRAVKK